MKILNRLPYSNEQTTVNVREEVVRVRPYQIVVWVSLHKNVKGTREADERKPHQLTVKEGIALYPDSTGPRLPVLGLRILTLNRLRSLVDGDRRYVTIRSALPWWWPFD